MQATTAPTAPQTPQAPTATAVITQPATSTSEIPVTVGDIKALRAKRSELSSQLENVASRRARLSSSLKGKEGVDRAGIEARISVLDKRMVQLETELDQTGQQLAMAPGALVAASESRQFNGMDSDAIAAISIASIIFIFFPLAFAAARRMWKRTNREVVVPALSGDAERRLERLEQGMDAIAIEIERVSEGQRFVTRLLSEAHNTPALPQAERDAVTVNRESR